METQQEKVLLISVYYYNVMSQAVWISMAIFGSLFLLCGCCLFLIACKKLHSRRGRVASPPPQVPSNQRARRQMHQTIEAAPQQVVKRQVVQGVADKDIPEGVPLIDVPRRLYRIPPREPRLVLGLEATNPSSLDKGLVKPLEEKAMKEIVRAIKVRQSSAKKEAAVAEENKQSASDSQLSIASQPRASRTEL